ncbi:MAG: transcriptional regulator [Pirellulales bacterium]|nr:transcriptional regulator [Pirellulales bacterium]
MANSKGPPAQSPQSCGRFAYEGLERAIHEKARLGIMTCLATHTAGLAFTDLKTLCSLTDGNLNRHLHVLEEAGLVEIHKGVRHNRPQTTCRMTPEGRTRFLEYLGALEEVVADAAQAVASAPKSKGVSKGVLEGHSPA